MNQPKIGQRLHCFYCWNDATHHDDEVIVCKDHAPEGAPVLLSRYRSVTAPV